MKTFVGIVLLILSVGVFAQNSSKSTVISNTYFVLDLQETKVKVDAFLFENKVEVLKLEENKTELKISFELEPSQFELFSEAAEKWGFPAYRNLDSEDIRTKQKELQRENDFQLQQKQKYEELLSKISPEHEQYMGLWNNVREIENEVHNIDLDIESLAARDNVYLISITIVEESNTVNTAKFALVNMPGVSVSGFTLENPTDLFSSSNYSGYFLKYMFTRGKSYGLLGVYKNKETTAPTDVIDEIFVFGLGQDFYSRYLGRGTRKSLNLYSSFNMGYMLATGVEVVEGSGFLNAGIGLELLKTKYILIDTRFGYFVPVKNNRTMRGFTSDLSLNFVF